MNSSGVFTDTLGTPALTVAGTAPSNTTFTYTAPNGQPAAYIVKYATYTVQTAFGCTGITEYGGNGTTTASLVSEIDLPDNSKYTFTYEPTPGIAGNVTGRLAYVTLPTGGAISYAYSGGNNGINCSDGSAATLTRMTPDGKWIYAQVKGTGAASTTTITDPQSNQTVIQFQGIYETQRQVYQGSTSGTLLQTINTCYNGTTTPASTAACTTTAIALPMTQRAVTTILPGSSNLTVQHLANFSSSGVPTEFDDYEYGSGAVGSLLRKTLISYASLGNIKAFRQQVDVQDGSGHTLAQTINNFDETTPTATSGTPQHISVTGSRGNLTSVSQLVQGSTFLTSHFNYYDTGTPNTFTGVNGAVTTFNYADPTSTCGNSFLTGTSITQPVSMVTHIAWNCTGGVPTSSTNVNGNVTTATYNEANFWRPASVTDPTNSITTLKYPSPTQVESVLSFNSGGSVADNLVTLDGLGRTLLNQVRQTPGGSTYDTQQTGYDSLGRPAQITLPFGSSAGQTSSAAFVTTTSYDALNRPLKVTDAGGGTVTYFYSQNDVLVTQGPAPSGENAKSRQLEYDGLGRLISVCEISSAVGSGACGQTNAQTGFWTRYSYEASGNLTVVFQNAQDSGSTQSRTYSYDLIGRLLSEANPESGTTTYKYDTDSTCGTSSGDLVKKVDAVGNVTCFGYDALHRLLSKTYTAGTNAPPTDNKFFVYDSATVNGVAMANAKGRLAEAYTCSGSSCATKKTDEGFSYTARGEIAVQYQLSPNSVGFYIANYQYFPNGAIQQVSGLPTLPVFTYGLDGEGRINTMSASTVANQLVQNPLTGTSYNPASQPTAVNLGSGDSDAFTYDPNTGRMTQYQFNVSGQALVGKLTWNANGTLASQQTTDPFNSADTQNCAYTHDDLVRIASVNCGAATWQQNFAYDAFGNLTKTVPTGGTGDSFQPAYNFSTNRMTSINSFTPTYDADGNVLTNGAHTYTWDAEGKYVSVDGVSVTYDALGRSVELGSASQLFYLLDGSRILFNAQVARGGALKLPGGGQAIYDANNGGLVRYLHADYLGSFRLASTPAPVYSSSLAYAPFGEQYPTVNQGTANGFTGVGSDFAVDEYDFPARQLSNQGRWVSPDPASLAVVDPTNPQSWNRYAYVLNRTTNVIDPTGLCGQQPGPSRFCKDGDLATQDCMLDGATVNCAIVLELIGAGATTSTLIGGGSNGIYQIYLPGGSIQSAVGTPDAFTYSFDGQFVTISIGGNIGGNGVSGPNNGQQKPAATTPQTPQIGTCTQLEVVGSGVFIAGTAVQLYAAVADSTIILAPLGVTLHVFGGIGAAVGGVAAGVAVIGKDLGICQ